MKLVVNHLTKRYKDITAVNDVSLILTPGVWGLLGANGSGKTTLMRMLCGALKPTSGKILLDEKPITILDEKYRNILGYLPQNFGYYSEFSVEDYLAYVGALKGLSRDIANKRISELLRKVSLADVKKKHIRKLSGGMKRRVGLAQALLNEPQILVLDEPTAGLDPGERIHFRNIISEFAQERIVLISTHIVSDVEYIAMNNAIMKRGEIIALGSTDRLVHSMQGKVWQSLIPKNTYTRFKIDHCVVNMRSEKDEEVSVRYVSDYPADATAVLQEPRLEDLYLSLFYDEQINVEDC